MQSKDFGYSFQPSRCKGLGIDLKIILLTSLLFVIVSGKYTMAATNDSETRTKRRWFRREEGDSNASYSSPWKELVGDELNHQSSRQDLEGFAKEQHGTKHRLGLFHFGKIINPLSKLEAKNSNTLDDGTKNDKEDHPLRTNLWDLDLKWSFVSRKPDLLTRNSDSKRKQREKNIRLELDPEGYCRIFENISANDGKNQDDSGSPVVAIGRWKKRPWGVTIVVRPILALESPINATNLDENSEVHVVDEETEFVLHANNFHWNGFGSNPKLTQGTILFQKQKRSNTQYWWKSTTLAYSSILPVWPEELSEGSEGERNHGLGVAHSDLWRLSNILNLGSNNPNNGRWFRPVVGKFTAKGVIQKQ